jgi:hypothetical protein
MNNSLITYQKGNTTYIIPYKSKITVPDIQPGYTGMKIIIRKKIKKPHSVRLFF